MFNVRPIKIPTSCSVGFDKQYKDIYGITNDQEYPQKSILKSKITVKIILISDLKLYFRAVVIKTNWPAIKIQEGILTDNNRTKNLEMQWQTYAHLIFDKQSKNIL